MERLRVLATAPLRGPGLDRLAEIADVVQDPWLAHEPIRLYDADGLAERLAAEKADVVICEAPSYVGALGVFKAYQCEVVHAEMDADGLVPEALRQAISSVKAAGKR